MEVNLRGKNGTRHHHWIHAADLRLTECSQILRQQAVKENEERITHCATEYKTINCLIRRTYAPEAGSYLEKNFGGVQK